MLELHENEQYFFDAATVAHLVAFLSMYERPCLLCAPMVGRGLVEAGHAPTILDIDDRFSHLPGFLHWDIHRPQWIDRRFDIILCDPPFFTISLSRLFHALRILAHHDYSQPLLIGYLRRRQTALLGTFARFGLEPTGYSPAYITVQSLGRNEIEFFGNLGAEAHARLRGPAA
jgi:hypothetical protein